MEFSFEVVKNDKKTRARRGVIKTAHGQIATPAFSPVATKATLKALDPKDIKKTGSQVVLGNTYHLYLQPGLRVISKFGGFAPFMGWAGPTITDSGGYQVSFLKDYSHKDENDRSGGIIRITDEGAVFRSHIDGGKYLLTPELSMEIQKILGADIIMSLDDPESYDRTLKWEERSFTHWKKIKSKQSLFGIVQGGIDPKLRKKSLDFVLSMDFPGIAVGGKTIGADPKITAKALDTIVDLLPEDKPLHALGLGGGPEGIFEAVERGVDIFDNSSVTRMARTGLLFVYPQDGGKRENKFRVDIAKKKYKSEFDPVSKVCKCYTCQNFSMAYINHLFKSHEILAQRLATIHNVTFVNDLMNRTRESIEAGDFLALKSHWLS